MFSSRSRIWPTAPVTPLVSPYIDTDFFKDVSGERREDVLQLLTHILRTDNRFSWPVDVDRETAVPQVALGMFERLQSLLPVWAWKSPDSELERQISAQIDQQLFEDVLSQIRRHLAIGQLSARSFDSKEDELVPSSRVAESWQLKGPARLMQTNLNGRSFADLRYDFRDPSENTVYLSGSFTTSFPVEQLHKLQLYICPDNSWHSLTIQVEKAGKRYRAVNPNYLADFSWIALTWKEADRIDDSTRIKTWTLLEQVPTEAGERIENGPNKIGVKIILTKNSAIGAWVAKILRNYKATFDYIPFWRYVGTSLFLVMLNIGCTLFSCSFVAYSFARLRWPGRRAAFTLMLGTMMIPSQVTMIPQFLIMKWLGWYNTLYPLWVPSLFAGAFSVFLLHQFLKGIPRDLEDAAKIDGCGYWRIYWHVMLPLVRPTMAAIAIFTFTATWNDFMGPLIYLTDQRLYPLSLGLFALDVQTSGSAGSMGIMMAASLLMTVPVVVIFFIAARVLPEGTYLNRYERLSGLG